MFCEPLTSWVTSVAFSVLVSVDILGQAGHCTGERVLGLRKNPVGLLLFEESSQRISSDSQ